jgi:hypothetical protein
MRQPRVTRSAVEWLSAVITFLVVLSATVSFAQQLPPRDLLALARQSYNDRKFDDAIKLAAEARTAPDQADAAAVVLARAHLGRYGLSFDAADLTEARDALKVIDPGKLGPREAVEFVVALGLSCHLDARYGAAAEMFELALSRGDALDAAARDRLLDWWATSLDRQAQFAPGSADRRAIYARILERMEREVERNAQSAVATFWMAAAARGTDDLERAAGAAEAGWIRAGFIGPAGVKLRDDLDRLMRHLILPERAVRLSPGGEPKLALEALLVEWEEVKRKWRR